MSDESSATPQAPPVKELVTEIGAERFQRLKAVDESPGSSLNTDPAIGSGVKQKLSLAELADPELVKSIRAELQTSMRVELENNLTDRMDKFTKELTERNETVVNEELEKIRALSKPMTPEDIQVLLSQEYMEFKVQLPGVPDGGTKEFCITELPQSVERKFYNVMRTKVVPLIPIITAVTNKLFEGDALENIKDVVETIEPLMEVMCELAALCLNPRGELAWVTVDWVRDHLSTARMYQVLRAQLEANRLRDFFSGLSLDTTQVPKALPAARIRG
jgi:hypothetical protein